MRVPRRLALRSRAGALERVHADTVARQQLHAASATAASDWQTSSREGLTVAALRRARKTNTAKGKAEHNLYRVQRRLRQGGAPTLCELLANCI